MKVHEPIIYKSRGVKQTHPLLQDKGVHNVPALIHNGEYINGSSAIFNYIQKGYDNTEE